MTNEMQTYALYALTGVAVFLILFGLVLKRRSRKRREEREAVAAQVEAEMKAERDKATAANLERLKGRQVLYRREVAQRGLDRVNGVAVGRHASELTYEQWEAQQGLEPLNLDDDDDEEVPAG